MNKLFFGNVQCNNVKIHYTHTSQGFPTVVMFHGLIGNGMSWNRLAMALNHVYDIYLPDARCHGFSECPTSGHTIQDLTLDAAEFIKTLNLAPVIAIGHSMGGAMVARLAAKNPEMVSAMILIDPPWYPPELMTREFGEKVTEDFRGNLRRYKNMSYEELAEEARRIHPTWSEDDIRPWVKSSQQMNPDFLDVTATIPENWEEVADQITQPALIMTGNNEYGAIVTPDILKKLVDRHPNWEATYYENCGHNIHKDDFKRSRIDILRYLRRLTLGY
jgi:pimeloyl-ACP methyl ester carboxylesterase